MSKSAWKDRSAGVPAGRIAAVSAAKVRTRSKPHPVRRLSSRDHFAPGRLELTVSWHDVTTVVTPHDHDFLEIALITRGRGEHISSRRRVLTAAGDVWVIRPGHWHTYMNVRRLGVYNCLIGRGLFRRLSPLLHGQAGAEELLWRGPLRQARDGCFLLRLGTRERLAAEGALDALARSLREGTALETQGRLLQFLGLLAGAARRAREGSTPRVDMQERSLAAAEAADLLETRYAEALGVGDLVRATGLSAPHLTRLFRRMTGQSPMRYLAGVRVQRACVLLAESGKSVTEIAGAVGWPDPNLFARRFRAALGCSPREYRQRHAGLGERELH